MKNILMLLAIAMFEYAIIAITTAIAFVLASCLIDKEEENLMLRQELIQVNQSRNRMIGISVSRVHPGK